jgi:hypothetical protein
LLKFEMTFFCLDQPFVTCNVSRDDDGVFRPLDFHAAYFQEPGGLQSAVS